MNDPVDDWFPLDAEEHLDQLDALRALFPDQPRRILDLGAGDGRLALPLVEAGHDVLALDHDPEAVAALGELGVRARRADFLTDDFHDDAGPFDVVLCMGHTFLLISDPNDARDLMRRLRRAVGRDARLVIDHFTEPLWREVAEGYWQNGVSEDGDMQMLWRPGDNVLMLRKGDAVDPDNWAPRDDDVPMRLWSRGELSLLALASGWTPPQPDSTGALLIFRADGAA